MWHVAVQKSVCGSVILSLNTTLDSDELLPLCARACGAPRPPAHRPMSLRMAIKRSLEEAQQVRFRVVFEGKFSCGNRTNQ
jgi:hypothetical protein